MAYANENSDELRPQRGLHELPVVHGAGYGLESERGNTEGDAKNRAH